MGFIFRILSVAGGWVGLVVLAMSVSAGLYLACEVAEEYSSIVKRYLHRSTIAIGITYIILAIDGLPFLRCAFGFFSYISYLPLLANFPFVQPVSFPTIWALIVTIGNHICWFNYFLSYEYRDDLRANYSEGSMFNGGSPAMRVMGFLFIFVWMVPLGFFISLTSIEESLPFASSGGGPGGQRKAKGIFKSFVEKQNRMIKSRMSTKQDRYAY